MTLNVGGFIPTSITNGDGIRSVIFGTGCTHNCIGCHNKHLSIPSSGESMSLDDILLMVNKNADITNKCVTFSGGDPFFQAKEFSSLAKLLKENGFNIWCYTGYTIEEILQSKNQYHKILLSNIDVLIDGKFDASLSKKPPKYRGSHNQRILHTQDYL